MMVVRAYLFPLLTLLAAFLTAHGEQLSLSQPVLIESGQAAVIGSFVTDAPQPAPPSEAKPVMSAGKSTVAPVIGTTKKASSAKPEEKTVTEQIRTYIEDSVKSVKSAISKIGKFVGELFEQDAPANSTVAANASRAVPSTPIPPSGAASTPIPPPPAAQKV